MRVLLPVIICLISFTASTQTVIEINPSKDNTIADQTPDASNGSGNVFFAGKTASKENKIFRALVQFDLSSIPADETISSVELRLSVTKGASGSDNKTYGLFKLSHDWGEGASSSSNGSLENAQNDDVTWEQRFFGTESPWDNPGGDFSATVSAESVYEGTSEIAFSSDQLKEDILGWINDPSTNFGWILRGPENENRTALRIASRENTNVDLVPVLVITLESMVNLAPEFNDQTFSISQDASVGTLVGTLEASDPENDPVSFQIISGDPENDFRIEGDQLIVNDTPGTTNYNLMITASDGTNSSQAMVEILVESEDDVTLTVQEADQDLVLFPNPSDDYLRVSGNNVKAIRCYNLNGKLLKKVNGNELSVKELSLGTYIIEIQTKKGRVVNKKIYRK